VLPWRPAPWRRRPRAFPSPSGLEPGVALRGAQPPHGLGSRHRLAEGTPRDESLPRGLRRPRLPRPGEPFALDLVPRPAWRPRWASASAWCALATGVPSGAPPPGPTPRRSASWPLAAVAGPSHWAGAWPSPSGARGAPGWGRSCATCRSSDRTAPDRTGAPPTGSSRESPSRSPSRRARGAAARRKVTRPRGRRRDQAAVSAAGPRARFPSTSRTSCTSPSSRSGTDPGSIGRPSSVAEATPRQRRSGCATVI
jgi:hypothetical protein